MKWLEVAINTSPEYEDYISSILYDLGADGLTIEDPKDVLDLKEQEGEKDWIVVEEDLIKLDEDEIIIKAYYSEENNIDEIKNYILERVERIPYMQEGKRYGRVEFTDVDDKDWSETWKQFYKPTRVGENLIIKPSWEEYDKLEDDLIIELDPGMAFGTGTHETTIMCGEALEEYVKKDDFIYDVGCGSGILSIIAAKLGAKEIVSVDIDPTCTRVTRENAVVNDVEDKISILEGDLLKVVDKDKPKADLVVANIIAEIIVDLVDDLDNYLKIDGIFIASGIIEEKYELVEESLIKNRFEILETKKMNDWVCIIAKR